MANLRNATGGLFFSQPHEKEDRAALSPVSGMVQAFFVGFVRRFFLILLSFYFSLVSRVMASSSWAPVRAYTGTRLRELVLSMRGKPIS